MTTLNALAPNPAREVCDYLHIWPPWRWRMDNVTSNKAGIVGFDLINTTASINKIIHVSNVPGIGFAIWDVEESLTH